LQEATSGKVLRHKALVRIWFNMPPKSFILGIRRWRLTVKAFFFLALVRVGPI